MTPFQDVIATEQELRDLVGTPAARSILKERPACWLAERWGTLDASPSQ